MANIRILLDLDEVLVDFIGGAIGLHNSSLEDVLPHWPPGHWSVVPALGKALGREFIDEDFWRPITNRGRGFWLGLLVHPWAEDLLKLVRDLTDDWHIVTSPSRCPASNDGKVRWARNYFGPDFTRFAITPHKEIMAGPNVVLIDDSDANVRKFREAGGRAIVFPRHHNSLHRLKDNPLKYVRHALAVHYGEIQDAAKKQTRTIDSILSADRLEP